jgi:S1-C subfamily serine protease
MEYRLLSLGADHDIALLEPAQPVGQAFRYLEIGDQYDLGAQVKAVGFPLAGTIAASLGTSATDIFMSRGTLCSIRRQGGTPRWLQIDCDVAGGASGGPVIDMRSGKVVGIVTMAIDLDAFNTAGATQSFAIPAGFATRRFGALLSR